MEVNRYLASAAIALLFGFAAKPGAAQGPGWLPVGDWQFFADGLTGTLNLEKVEVFGDPSGGISGIGPSNSGTLKGRKVSALIIPETKKVILIHRLPNSQKFDTYTGYYFNHEKGGTTTHVLTGEFDRLDGSRGGWYAVRALKAEPGEPNEPSPPPRQEITKSIILKAGPIVEGVRHYEGRWPLAGDSSGHLLKIEVSKANPLNLSLVHFFNSDGIVFSLMREQFSNSSQLQELYGNPEPSLPVEFDAVVTATNNIAINQVVILVTYTDD